MSVLQVIYQNLRSFVGAVPGAPTIGTATIGSLPTASIPFTAPASNGGSTITSYTATSTPGNITGVLNQAGSGTIEVSGLTSGTSYTFKVTATNAIGTGPESAASNSVTVGVVGQATYTTAGTYSWVAPAGVTRVSVVTVGGGGGSGSIPYNSTLATAGGSSSFNSVCVAGGGGRGLGASPYTGGVGGVGSLRTGGSTGGAGSTGSNNPGCGGAGGYSGNGGAGVTAAGGANGGGVGLLGEGASGAGGGGGAGNGTGGGGGGGYNGVAGGAGSGGSGMLYGGGGSASGGGGGGTGGGGGGGGGALSYSNTLTVVPGSSYQVIVGAAGNSSVYGKIAGPGAVRIIWPGTHRFFPGTNTGDLG